ncbi:MAG: putative CRISPR-associated protein [Zoogloeaceae bacterium]|jgi:putative CRISPR-associated protein (TIGR02619 family)|nr:putative CRISPR-associated protein [Zoogloeaceae bacterium]
MRTLILSTCGTSLLTNLEPAQRELVYQHANTRNPDEIPEEARRRLQMLVANTLPEKLREASPAEQARLSAELNGILRYYGGHFNARQDIHWLIATDTWLGEATGKAVGEVLERQGQRVVVKRISDLRTDNLEEFRLGMSELARLCAQEVKSMRDSGYRVVFNLTGGFKSVQGFMQALGMLYADESIYVFESTSELLRLPRLPISMNALELARKYERIFRRCAAKLSLSHEDTENVPEPLLMSVGDEITLSPWGDVVWSEAGEAILSEELLPSIDAKLRYDGNFPKTLQNCSKKEIHQVNERLGDLARYLNDGTNPNRLDFKKLQASPKGRCTHECDAWAQGGAKRLFGYYDEDVFVVVELAAGLH